MGRLAGRYAAGYAYEYDRAAKLEAELSTAQKIIEAREAQIAHLQDDRPLAEQVRQEAPEGGGVAAIIGAWPGDETDEEIEEATMGHD